MKQMIVAASVIVAVALAFGIGTAPTLDAKATPTATVAPDDNQAEPVCDASCKSDCIKQRSQCNRDRDTHDHKARERCCHAYYQCIRTCGCSRDGSC